MKTQLHEGAKWIATSGAGVSAWATLSGQEALNYVGVTVAILSALGSWYIAQRSQLRKAEREQAALDQTSAREQRWLDAFQEWQIQQMRAGVIQFPRTARAPVPAPGPPTSPGPVPLYPPGPSEAPHSESPGDRPSVPLGG